MYTIRDAGITYVTNTCNTVGNSAACNRQTATHSTPRRCRALWIAASWIPFVALFTRRDYIDSTKHRATGCHHQSRSFFTSQSFPSTTFTTEVWCHYRRAFRDHHLAPFLLDVPGAALRLTSHSGSVADESRIAVSRQVASIRKDGT